MIGSVKDKDNDNEMNRAEEIKGLFCRLALLCGKYESNAIALRLALGVSDRAIEAYDVLLALLETELAIERNDEGIFIHYWYRYNNSSCCNSYVIPGFRCST